MESFATIAVAKQTAVQNEKKDVNNETKPKNTTVAVEKRDPYDVMVELAAQYGEENTPAFN